MMVRRHGEVTVSVAHRPFELPQKGSFAFQSLETSQPDDPHISSEVWGHARLVLGKMLPKKVSSLNRALHVPRYAYTV